MVSLHSREEATQANTGEGMVLPDLVELLVAIQVEELLHNKDMVELLLNRDMVELLLNRDMEELPLTNRAMVELLLVSKAMVELLLGNKVMDLQEDMVNSSSSNSRDLVVHHMHRLILRPPNGSMPWTKTGVVR